MDKKNSTIPGADKISFDYNLQPTHTRHTISHPEEQWKQIDGWPYEVSTLGRVRRINPKNWKKKEFIIGGKAGKPGKQYPVVTLSVNQKKKTFYRHHLVALAFLGPTPADMEIDHKDGNRMNPALENLEFKTPAKNIQESVARGHRGSNRWNARLTESVVIEMRAMYDDGWTVQEIADKFKMNFTTTYHVIRRNNWKHVA